MPFSSPPDLPDEKREVDRTYRPLSLSDFIGQEEVVKVLRIAIQSARERKDPLDHVLLSGPPGIGKTTLAEIVSKELGVPFERVSGPMLERPKDLASLLARLPPRAVFFIDEIHRLPKVVEELLYLAMEDFRIHIVLGEGGSARIVDLPLPPFTIIGATTRQSMLARPLLDRFGITLHLEYYKEKEIARILFRYASSLDLLLTEEGAYEIARRSQGTPRLALAHFRRVQDYLVVVGEKILTGELVRKAFLELGVDEQGFQRLQRKYLEYLTVTCGGGPLSLTTLAQVLGEDPSTVELVVEPFLIRQGFVERTPRGRVATLRAFQYFSPEGRTSTGKEGE
jgi:Holliday junction DNA helicase RuvB